MLENFTNPPQHIGKKWTTMYDLKRILVTIYRNEKFIL